MHASVAHLPPHTCDGALRAIPTVMATYNPYVLHDHAGARWLAPAGVAFLVGVLTAMLMLVYPHL
jgi:hypothetical protein